MSIPYVIDGETDLDSVTINPWIEAINTAAGDVSSQAASIADLTDRQGRTRLVAYDDFSRYDDGALSGKTPLVGDAWFTTGAGPTIISSGRAVAASSGDFGYAYQSFDSRPTLVLSEVSFAGSDPTVYPMTIAWDPAGDINNALHLNWGPKGYTLTLRKDAGSFTPIQTGFWQKPCAQDGTVYRFGASLIGNIFTIFGPNGEVLSIQDFRFTDAVPQGSCTVFWEPNNYDGTNIAYLHTCSAFETADTGYTANVTQADWLNGMGVVLGQNGEAIGNRFNAQQVAIGLEPNTLMPGIMLGASEIHAYLTESTIVGATTFKINQKTPPNSTIKIGNGSGGETLTQNASIASGVAVPFTVTTTGAATKAHSAGDPVTITPTSTFRTYLYMSTSNGFVNLFDTTIVVPNSAGFYFGSALDTRLYRGAADLLSMGTGDSFRVDGTWNGGHLLLGTTHIWVDSTGDLRIKASVAPTSDTDGTVIGTQS